VRPGHHREHDGEREQHRGKWDSEEFELPHEVPLSVFQS
jgi:hypothetical protein